MITPTTRRIISIVLVVLVVLVQTELPSRSLLLTVSFLPPSPLCTYSLTVFHSPDSKQARDLVNVLQEAKQAIDPRLAEMVRYGGGGGGGHGRWGGYRGRGGGGGGHRGNHRGRF